MRKIKEFLKSKALRVSLAVSALVSAFMVPAFAAEGDSSAAMTEITTTLTSSFTQVAGDILKIIGIAVVAAMTVIGVKIAVKAGIGFFKSLSKGN